MSYGGEGDDKESTDEEQWVSHPVITQEVTTQSSSEKFISTFTTLFFFKVKKKNSFVSCFEFITNVYI